MGLALDIKSPFADATIPGAYSRISGIMADFDTGSGQVRVSTYADRAARDAGYPPIPALTRNFNVPVTPFVEGQAGEDIRAALYGFLKSLPEFAGAADA